MSILHQLYQRMRTADQLDERFCQCCLSPLEDQTDLFTIFISDEYLCRSCSQMLEKSRTKRKKGTVRIYGLLKENEFEKDLITRYRRMNDRALASLFLRWSRPWLIFLRRFQLVAVIPCSQEEYIRKGYDPLAEIFLVHHIPAVRLDLEKDLQELIPAKFTLLAGWNEENLPALLKMAEKTRCRRILLVSQKEKAPGELKKYLRFNHHSL